MQQTMVRDLTRGPVVPQLIRFTLPCGEAEHGG